MVRAPDRSKTDVVCGCSIHLVPYFVLSMDNGGGGRCCSVLAGDVVQCEGSVTSMKVVGGDHGVEASMSSCLSSSMASQREGDNNGGVWRRRRRFGQRRRRRFGQRRAMRRQRTAHVVDGEVLAPWSTTTRSEASDSEPDLGWWCGMEAMPYPVGMVRSIRQRCAAKAMLGSRFTTAAHTQKDVVVA